jgi:hypothetical protein
MPTYDVPENFENRKIELESDHLGEDENRDQLRAHTHIQLSVGGLP